MAYILVTEPMLKRIARNLNPCRWCGEGAQFRVNHRDYEFAQRVAVMCPCRVEWMVWPDPVLIDNRETYWDMLRTALIGLLKYWNARHDGPGFLAGLA